MKQLLNNTELINSFYNGFKKLDYEAMKNAYHSEVVFSDPVFNNLDFNQVTSMWKMLCLKAQEFHLRYEILEINDGFARVKWEADYLFSKTNRTVKNKVIAEMYFKDGKIIKHIDSFNLWKWSQMALGPVGLILGWTPFMKKKIQAQAMGQLKNFQK
jgi:ABC-type enterochelin transport system ATPase subunit